MQEMEGVVETTEPSGTFGTEQTTKGPVAWSIMAEAAAQHSSDFESVLLAIAGHDLRQPLQVIQSTHELLGLRIRTKHELRLLQIGQGAIDRLKDQLGQLLAALRFREHAEGVKLTPVRVGPLLRQAFRENETAALQRGVRVRMVETSATILSNPLLLNTILRNLVSNAIKYSRPGGRILLGCRHVGQDIRIDVYDNGIGIERDQTHRIFEAFTRLDPTRRDGLGVGLFIVRQAVGILKHRVDITSAPSQGSRFSILTTKAEKMANRPHRAGPSWEVMSGAPP